jgi:hypothetical protein
LTPDCETVYAYDSPVHALKADIIAVDAQMPSSSPSRRKQATRIMQAAIQKIQARSLQNLLNTRLERLQGHVFTGDCDF